MRLIAWAWILSGLLNGFGALAGVFSAGLLHGLATTGVPQAAQSLGGALGTSRYAVASALFQLALSVVAVLAGIDFLRLKAWARTALEWLSWLSLAYLAVAMIYWWRFWNAFTASGSFAGVSVDLAPYRTPGLILGALLIAALAVPLGLMIRALRGPAVRRALAAARSGPVAGELEKGDMK